MHIVNLTASTFPPVTFDDTWSATKKSRQGSEFAHHLERDSSLKGGCWKPKEASHKNRRYSLRTG